VAVQREKLSFADVRRVGMDETSARKGQDYVTTFMDLDARRVLFATEGRDGATVAAFADDLTGYGRDPERISDTSSDMSPAFIAGIGEHLPKAKLTYDRYHVIAKLNEAVDQVRRAEQKDNPALKKTRYVWLKNRANLTVKQQDTLTWLTRPSMHLATARAHRWREDFQEFYDLDTAQAPGYLRSWCYGAKRSRLQTDQGFRQTRRNALGRNRRLARQSDQ
jgi:transposase